MHEQNTKTSMEWAPSLKEIAREMGELALAMAAAGGVLVESKSDGSKVTAIDRALNELLIQRAESVFPGSSVWSEEGSTAEYGDIAEIEDRILVLGDPIDGTNKLVRSLEGGDMSDCRSTVMLAAFAPNETVPSAALVYAPFLPDQPMYWADEGGSYLEYQSGDTSRLRVAAGGPKELAEAKTFKISKWDGSVPGAARVQKMLPNALHERGELRMTSVARGAVDISIFPGPISNLHDIIPPLYIARQAGATTMALDGRPFEELMDGRPVPGVLAAVSSQLAERAINYLNMEQ